MKKRNISLIYLVLMIVWFGGRFINCEPTSEKTEIPNVKYTETPQKVLERYLFIRTHDESSKYLQPIVSKESKGMGCDSGYTVISGYKIKECDVRSNIAKCRVNFNVIGVVTFFWRVSKEKKAEEIEYTVVLEDGAWKMLSLKTPPFNVENEDIGIWNDCPMILKSIKVDKTLRSLEYAKKQFVKGAPPPSGYSSWQEEIDRINKLLKEIESLE